MKATRKQLTQRRHFRIRRRVEGTGDRPRLAVFRSHKHIYAQVIDDEKQHTLAAASTLDKDLKGELASGGNISASTAVGNLIAKRALEKGITKVVFDRGGNLYHGRVKALADAAREAGLDF
ncbi:MULTISPECIES: 50S ribosomal protein L18 [unclassified Picosynechococcus]|uniref:50S ribosomal protein L18 n=1 Tax=unclassified Picosynechococcus TaxID=3079910 RepID=UPI000745879C|nr:MULTISPECIES: 50S ribosomal protein L18 [unclassified Picosynechococcus]AMA08794.1 50S ribosomal protein L18 [Picosynechococcus sp. PCC 73109]ANV90097.1 50S ribosomal protein L18 [Picosynechococcus sp. PCC 8807]